MRRLPAVLITLSLLAAGCGDDGGETASQPPADTPAAASTPAVAPGPDLREHVLVKGDLDAGDPSEPQYTADAAQWAETTDVDAETLRSSGFVEGLRQDHLPFGEVTGAALSIVVRYETPEQAAAEVNRSAEPAEGVKVTEFEVGGIPGAKGFSAESAGGSGHNVAFAVGELFHLLGAESLRASRKDLAAAAKRLYQRVK